MLTIEIDCLLTIRTFSNYFHVRNRVYQRYEALTNHSLIVDDYNANVFASFHGCASLCNWYVHNYFSSDFRRAHNIKRAPDSLSSFTHPNQTEVAIFYSG